MKRPRRPSFPARPRLRLLLARSAREGVPRWRFGLVCLVLAAGCAADFGSLTRPFSLNRPETLSVVRAAPPDEPRPHSEILGMPKPITLAPSVGTPTPVVTLAAPVATARPKVLPLSLDAIFRLAEEQNPQVKLAREQVAGASADLDLAKMSWLPKIHAGPAYWRHEGGIQDQNGQLVRSSTGALFTGVEVNAQLDIRDVTYQKVRAERELWQQRGELTRITHAQLLQAASAYMDLLAARTGEAVVRSIDGRIQELLRTANDLGETVPRAPVELVRAESHSNQMILLKLKQLAESSSAQLAYLLGVEPGTQFEPVDATLAPFALVDATPPLEVLVARAVTDGPGVREVQGMLDMLQQNLQTLNGPTQYLPVMEVRMVEGAFGAGAGASLAWDNRWDLGVQARWNLGGLITTKQQQRAAESRLCQAHLAMEELKAKLSAGVQEARETVHNTGQQIREGQRQIEHAEKSYQLLNDVMKTLPQKDRPLVDVLRAILALKQSQQDYLTAINSYDKAQLRLLLLLGPACR